MILFKYLTVASLFLLSACHTMINLPEPVMMNNKHVQISGGLSFPRPYVPISIAGQFKNFGLKIHAYSKTFPISEQSISSAQLSYTIKLIEKKNPKTENIKQLNIEPVLHVGQYFEKGDFGSLYYLNNLVSNPSSRYASIGSTVAFQIFFGKSASFTSGSGIHVGYADQYYKTSKVTNNVSPGSSFAIYQIDHNYIKTMFVGVSPYIRYQWEYFFVEYTAGMVVGGAKLKASPYARIKVGLTF